MQNSTNNKSIRSALQKVKEEFEHTLPISPGFSPVGYAAPCNVLLSLKEQEQMDLYALAEEILEDPEALRQFSNLVYELMQKDIQYQCDRFGRFKR